MISRQITTTEDNLRHELNSFLEYPIDAVIDSKFKALTGYKTVADKIWTSCEKSSLVDEATGTHVWTQELSVIDTPQYLYLLLNYIKNQARRLDVSLPFPLDLIRHCTHEDHVNKLVGYHEACLSDSVSKPENDDVVNNNESVVMTNNHIEQYAIPKVVILFNNYQESVTEHPLIYTTVQFVKHAKCIFKTQARRHFVLGLVQVGETFSIMQCDRLGVIASTFFSARTDSRALVDILVGFMFLDDAAMGYDPTISRFDDISMRLTNGISKKFHLDNLLFRTACTISRGSTIWGATDEHGDKYTVKDSFQPLDKAIEGEIYQLVAEPGSKYIAEYFAHENCLNDGKEITIQTSSRAGLDNTCCKKIVYPLHNIITDDSHKSTKERLLHPEDRVHRRLILKSQAVKLTETESPVEILIGILGAVKGLSYLFSQGILHRDISPGNIMLSSTRSHGLLIDFDLAWKMSEPLTPENRLPTGTRAFMAIGALQSHQHIVCFDLESCFWVLFWLTKTYNGHDKPSKLDHEMTKWPDMNDQELYTAKQSILTSDLGSRSTFFCKALVETLVRLKDCIFVGEHRDEGRSVDDLDLFEQMETILKQDITHLTLIHEL